MTTTVFAKHPDLWFDDGNVVLVAENTAFRLYRGLLTRQSEIFRDMFLMPQSEAIATETYEGCPVVRMTGDGAEEWVDVLRILCETNESQRCAANILRVKRHDLADHVAPQLSTGFIAPLNSFLSISWRLPFA